MEVLVCEVLGQTVAQDTIFSVEATQIQLLSAHDALIQSEKRAVGIYQDASIVAYSARGSEITGGEIYLIAFQLPIKGQLRKRS